MEGLPTNLDYLEEPFAICLPTKGNQIPKGPTIDV